MKDPGSLPENRYVAYATLKSTEKRLIKNTLHAEIYIRQMEDMFERKIAWEVSEMEMNQNQGTNTISPQQYARNSTSISARKFAFIGDISKMFH